MNSLDDFIARKNREYELYRELIITMLGNDEAYGFSSRFLESLLENITAKGQISDKQKEAVDNIYSAAP